MPKFQWVIKCGLDSKKDNSCQTTPKENDMDDNDNEIDLSAEVKDLVKMYEEKLEYYKSKESEYQTIAEGYMAEYLDIKEERLKMEEKLQVLLSKILEEGDDE